MSRAMRALIAGAICLLAAVPATPAHAAFAGENGRIAFRSAAPIGNISSVNPDGTGPTSLQLGGLLDPQWSPDGTRIAFVDCRGGRNGCDIYLMNADGSGVRELVSFRSSDRTPAWSPDGTKILFASSGPNGESDTWDTYVINVDGTDATKVSDHGALEAEWSADGQNVFFAEAGSRYPASGGGIWQMRPDGRDAVRLIGGEPDATYESPAISPDGTEVAFSKTTPAVGSQIFTMNADSTNVKQITTTGASHVAWSPDGTKLVIDGLATVNTDGSGLEKLGVTGFQPDWQPVGPRRIDYKNASAYCKGLHDFLGDAEFGKRYKNHGKCVSAYP